jgi:hypothetical protein
MVHLAFEQHFNTPQVTVGGCLAALLAPFDEAILTPHEQKAHNELKGLVEPLTLWKDAFPIQETLEAELPFETSILEGLLKFQGRPDRVVVLHDKVFHFQHKTLGGSKSLATFLAIAPRNLHENLYADWLSKLYYPRPYGGTIYNVVRKLKYRSTSKSKEILHTPEEMFGQFPIPISKESMNEAVKHLTVVAHAMIETAESYASGYFVPSNRHFDSGYYGNSLDPYVAVMTGEASLDDERLFQDRKDPYAKEESEE